LWHFGSQAFSHVGSQQAFSHAFGQAFSQAAGQQAPQALWHFFALQGFSQQAGSGQQPFAGQHAFGSSQMQPLLSNKSFKSANMSRTGVGRHFLPQADSQAGSQALGQAFAQAGSQAFGQAFSQQAGSQGFGQAFSQALGQAFSQQATLAQALHSPQPPLFSPSMRSRSSKPNPWLHRAALTRSAPKIVLLFIEQQLLYSELGFEKRGSSPAVHTVYCARAVEPILGPIFT
jgi:hypothetical protein